MTRSKGTHYYAVTKIEFADVVNVVINKQQHCLTISAFLDAANTPITLAIFATQASMVHVAVLNKSAHIQKPLFELCLLPPGDQNNIIMPHTISRMTLSCANFEAVHVATATKHVQAVWHNH